MNCRGRIWSHGLREQHNEPPVLVVCQEGHIHSCGLVSFARVFCSGSRRAQPNQPQTSHATGSVDDPINVYTPVTVDTDTARQLWHPQLQHNASPGRDIVDNAHSQRTLSTAHPHIAHAVTSGACLAQWTARSDGQCGDWFRRYPEISKRSALLCDWVGKDGAAVCRVTSWRSGKTLALTRLLEVHAFLSVWVHPRSLNKKFGQFVDFEFLMEMGSWGTNYMYMGKLLGKWTS